MYIFYHIKLNLNSKKILFSSGQSGANNIEWNYDYFLLCKRESAQETAHVNSHFTAQNQTTQALKHTDRYTSLRSLSWYLHFSSSILIFSCSASLVSESKESSVSAPDAIFSFSIFILYIRDLDLTLYPGHSIYGYFDRFGCYDYRRLGLNTIFWIKKRKKRIKKTS